MPPPCGRLNLVYIAAMQFSEFYQPPKGPTPEPKLSLPRITDPEMYALLVYKLLQVGDVALTGPSILEPSQQVKVVGWPQKYVGRLDGNPGGPGIYDDFLNITVQLIDTNEVITIPATQLGLPPSEDLLERYDEISSSWFNMSSDLGWRASLPDTKIWESDIVTVDGSVDQFQVFRIDHFNKTCLLKGHDKKVTRPYSFDELQFLTGGPVKAAYSGEEVRFKDTKSAAEFQILLGWFSRNFYPINQSYNWDVAHAVQVINLSKAHGLLHYRNGVSLITLANEDIGSELLYLTQTNPSMILKV